MMLRDFAVDDLTVSGDADADIGSAYTGLTLVDDDGEVVSYACIACVNDRDWLFFWSRPDRPRAAAVLHRSAVGLLNALPLGGFSEIFSVCDYKYGEGADRWLKRLGFTPLADDEKCEEILAHERSENARVFKMWLSPALGV